MNEALLILITLSSRHMYFYSFSALWTLPAPLYQHLLMSLIHKLQLFAHSLTHFHPELSGCITTLTVRNTEVANFCAAMDTLIDQDDSLSIHPFTHPLTHSFTY